jgi:hypothetical protein
LARVEAVDCVVVVFTSAAGTELAAAVVVEDEELGWLTTVGGLGLCSAGFEEVAGATEAAVGVAIGGGGSASCGNTTEFMTDGSSCSFT